VKEEILINAGSREVRAALVSDGILQGFLIERQAQGGVLGNIYKGKVSRVLPSMQAAFIDIGLSRTAFLHASDIVPSPSAPMLEGVDMGETDISRLIRDGQEVLVQVIKEPLGNKGARLTTFIAMPSRYLVMLPGRPTLGISARIEAEAERERLRELAIGLLPDQVVNGYILRTAAEGASAEALQADALVLQKIWESIGLKSKAAKAGDLVYEDLPLAVRIVRDMLHPSVERVLVDSEECLATMQRFSDSFLSDSRPAMELYSERQPILDLYGIEDEIQGALCRKVNLKSGGYLIFDQTEAMTTVDVNSGGFVGQSSPAETAFLTNLEAAVAIARQLRLRNLGGIIILDFIDMDAKSHQEKILAALDKALAADHATTQIAQVSPLGLVEMTRKRTRESLEHVMCEPCPTCSSAGYIKSPETVCYEIFREIMRQDRQFEVKELVVIAHDNVVEMLLNEEASGLAQLAELIGKTIRLQAQAISAQHEFDVVPV
jgi:ribonuclease G